MEQQQRRARNQAFCQTSPRCNGKFTEESLIEYLILASALETCEFNKVSELDFLLSKTALEGVLQMAGQKSTGLSAVTWCLPGINLSGSREEADRYYSNLGRASNDLLGTPKGRFRSNLAFNGGAVNGRNR